MSDVPKVLVTLDLPSDIMERLRSSCQLTTPLTKYPMPRDELLSLIKGQNGLLCTSDDKINEELFAHAGESLKIVSTMSAGYNHIDLEAARSHKVLLSHTPDVLTDSVAEVNVGLTLALLRGFVKAANFVTTGEWEKSKARVWNLFEGLGDSLVGKTIGFLGLGRIGIATAKRLKPFGIGKIIYCNRNPSTHAEELSAVRVSMDKLAEESDVLIICASLNETTHHIVNQQFLEKMKPSSYIINTSRGPLVDQDALVEALKQGKIKGAGLDVMVPEPLPASSELARLPNVVLFPHMGSATVKTRNDMATLAVDNVLKGVNGEEMVTPIKD